MKTVRVHAGPASLHYVSPWRYPFRAEGEELIGRSVLWHVPPDERVLAVAPFGGDIIRWTTGSNATSKDFVMNIECKALHVIDLEPEVRAVRGRSVLHHS